MDFSIGREKEAWPELEYGEPLHPLLPHFSDFILILKVTVFQWYYAIAPRMFMYVFLKRGCALDKISAFYF